MYAGAVIGGVIGLGGAGFAAKKLKAKLDERKAARGSREGKEEKEKLNKEEKGDDGLPADKKVEKLKPCPPSIRKQALDLAEEAM